MGILTKGSNEQYIPNLDIQILMNKGSVRKLGIEF